MKHLCDVVSEPGHHIVFVNGDGYFFNDNHLIDLLQKECSPYVTKDNHGVIACMAGDVLRYFFSTSAGHMSETAFDINGKRIMDDRELPKILRMQCASFLDTGTRGAITYMSKVEYDNSNLKKS